MCLGGTLVEMIEMSAWPRHRALAEAPHGSFDRVCSQGCVPLIIMDEPDSKTDVEQAFEELLPYANFSLRLRQTDIPNLPAILGAYPYAPWLQLRKNLACVWPRMLWLQTRGIGVGRAQRSDERLKAHDAFATLMATLRARLARLGRYEDVRSFEWRTPASSCEEFRLMGSARMHETQVGPVPGAGGLLSSFVESWSTARPGLSTNRRSSRITA